MIKFLMNRAADAMEQRYTYDASYMREVAALSTGASIRLGLLPLFSQYSAGVPVDLWAGTAMGSTLDGDCGPCLQLVVDMAREKGACPVAMRAVLEGNYERAGVTGLGFRFALAAIEDGADLEPLREEIVRDHGAQAVATLSIVAATGRTWPVIKRGLGHGRICQSVQIDQVDVDLSAARGAHATAIAG